MNVLFFLFFFGHVAFFPTGTSGTRKLEYAGSTWHEGCFVCHACEQPIGSKSFIPEKDEHYCVPCYEDKFAPRCTRCHKVGQWLADSDHASTLRSPVLGNGSGLDRRLTAASSSFQTLAKGGVTYRDEPWHKECFVCSGCKTQLAGQHFTSRDDSPYCLKCFGSLYAKKCEACSKPITGKSVARDHPLLPLSRVVWTSARSTR